MATLEELSEEYITEKQKEDALHKVTQSLNKQIKDLMDERDTKSVSTSVGDLFVQIRSSESFDEENLIEYLKSSGLARGIVKKREYIDYDALESAIYHEKIAGDNLKKMNKYKIIKETKALTIKRKGE